MAASVKSLLSRPLSLLLLLFFHLGCFTIFSSAINPQSQAPPPKRRKITPLSPSPSISSPSPKKSLPRSIFSYLNRSFILLFRQQQQQQQQQDDDDIIQQSQLKHLSLSPDHKSTPLTLLSPALAKPPPLPVTRAGIFPCSACGEVLTRPQLLDLHQATKHSLSELREGDSGNNIVRIIFTSGWKGSRPPAVHRVLKIHNAPRTLSRFEEYREIVRSRGGGDERCLADGNERLRFYCSTALCAAGQAAVSGVCGSAYCVTCGIVRHGFAGKQADLDGIATHVTGWGAHVSLPEELESEFGFLRVRRAMLVCRVVAGRVARGGQEAVKGATFDSVVPVGRRRAAVLKEEEEEEEELLVFNPRAVLPCFVIIYSM